MIEVVSGICPVEHLGAGRMIRWLEAQREFLPDWKINYASNKSGASACLKKKQIAAFPRQVALHFLRRLALYRQLSKFASSNHLLLLHFQEIGFDWCLRLLSRRTNECPIWIYLFDSAFFCRKSYNHHSKEDSACLRCVGGRFQEADALGCTSYPRKSPKCQKFLVELQIAAACQKVGFFAQNKSQEELARRHFGSKAIVETVGVWTDDTEDLVQEFFANPGITTPENANYDVVFHGNPQATKGFYWAIDVARFCPALRFLFPCDSPGVSVPSNCHFIPMRWNTGLSDHVRSSPVTLVPSLWSAPVEGALIKTFLVAPMVGVVEEPTTFSSEFEQGSLLGLPHSPEEAGKVLANFVRSPISVPHAQKESWIAKHRSSRDFLKKIDSKMKEFRTWV